MNKPGIDWSPQEASSINEFLNSPLGNKWLGLLFSLKPAQDLSSSERAALSGVYRAGYELVFDKIRDSRSFVLLAPNVDKPPIDSTKD